MTSIHDLPDEVLAEIFSYLNVEQLKVALTVTRRWNNIGKRPHIWKKYDLVVNPSNFFSFLDSCSKVKIQKPISEIVFSFIIFERAQWRPKKGIECKKITLRNCLSDEEAEDLVSSVKNFEELSLENEENAENPDALILLHESMSKLKKLNFGMCSLEDIDTDIIVSLLRRLEEADMWECLLSSEQCQEICFQLSKDVGNLRHLRLGGYGGSLSKIHSSIVVNIARQLDKFKINFRDLQVNKQIHIFDALAKDKGQLKALGIRGRGKRKSNGNNTFSFFSRVIENLNELHLKYFDFNDEIANVLSKSNFTLEEISLHDLEECPKDLAKILRKVKSVEISVLQIPDDEFVSIAKALAEDSGHLQSLKILDLENPAHRIDTDILTKLTRKLKYLDMGYIRPKEINLFFQNLSKDVGELETLDLRYVDLKSVNAMDIFRVFGQLKEVKVDPRMCLTELQLLFLFENLAENTIRLKRIGIFSKSLIGKFNPLLIFKVQLKLKIEIAGVNV